MNWRRHLLLFGSRESEFMETSREEGIARLTEAGRYRDTESTETESDKFLFWGMLLATREAL
jgi:hypothetical protein